MFIDKPIFYFVHKYACYSEEKINTVAQLNYINELFNNLKNCELELGNNLEITGVLHIEKDFITNISLVILNT